MGVLLDGTFFIMCVPDTRLGSDVDRDFFGDARDIRGKVDDWNDSGTRDWCGLPVRRIEDKDHKACL